MGYDETTNLKLKKPALGTSKNDWPGYINANFDAIDTEVANRHKVNEDILPDGDNIRSLGSLLKRFLNGFFNQITLGGVTRTTWPSPGSGSQSMDDTYNNGSVVNVDASDEVHQLASGKKFKLVNSDGTITYMEAEGGKGITYPGNDIRQNLLTNSGFQVWSNSTLENVGASLITGWTNDGFETFASSGANVTSAINTTGYGNCYQAITLTAGKLYKAVVVLTLNSGTAPTIITGTTNTGGNGSLGLVAANVLVAGTNTKVFKAGANDTIIALHNYSAAAADWSATVTLYEVTPGCVASDTKAMDGWVKGVGALVYRQYNDSTYTRDGSFYSVKIIGGASGNQIFTPVSYADMGWVARFKGRTVTFGCWVWGNTASKTRISVYDTQHNYSSYHSGSGAWEWLEVTRAVPTGATQFYVGLYAGTSTTAYFSQPQLVFGNSLGAGNYAPVNGEIIWTETAIAIASLDNKTGFSTTASISVSIEAETQGSLGRGVKAVYVGLTANDTASATADATIVLGSAPTVTCAPAGLANSRNARSQGWVILAASEVMNYILTATGSGTLAIPRARVYGVQL